MTADPFAMPRERRRPSIFGYVLGVLVFVAAVAGAIVWFALGIWSISAEVDDLARVSIPGRATVVLGAGKQSVYYEGRGRVPPLRISLRTADGEPVAIGPHGGSVSYDVDGRKGRSIGGLRLEHGGRYRLAVHGPDRGAQLAVGDGVGGRIVGSIVGALVIFLGGCLLAGGIVVWTAARRRRATVSAAT